MKKPAYNPTTQTADAVPSFQDQQLTASGKMLWLQLEDANDPLSGAVLRGLEKLLDLAETDTPEGRRARRHLSDVLIFIVSRMNQLARRNPNQWRPITEGGSVWPVVASLHPQWLKGIEPEAAVRVLLEKTLRLGSKSIFVGDSYAKSKLTSPNTQAAHSLIELILAARSPLARKGLPAEVTTQSWFKEWLPTACALKPYCKDTAPDWANVAAEAFKCWCPEPEKTALADEVGAHWTKDKEGAEGIKAESYTLGRLRGRIRDRVKQAIRRLAPEHPS